MKITLFLLSFIVYFLFFYRHEALFISQYYHRKRYFLTLFQEYKTRMKKRFYQFLILSFLFFLFFLSSFYIVLFFLLGWLLYYFLSTPYIPFKKTRRSITLLITCLVLLGILLYFSPSFFYIFYAILIPIFVPFLLALSALIVTPYEKCIQHYYIRQAKKKLRMNPNLQVIAITGSYGKSSFKKFLYQFLKTKYQVIMTPKSVNTPMGITKFINENLQENIEIIILEFGVDEKGGMDRLLKIVVPQIGVLTAVGKMHLKTFHSLEGIYQEKRKLIDQAKKGYFSLDSDFLKERQDELQNKEGYSYHEYFSAIKRTEQGLEVEYRKERITIPIYGLFQLENISGAIKIALSLGVSYRDIRCVLPSLEGVEHRFTKRKEETLTIFDDAYNSNDKGMLEAIQTVMLQKGKKAIITPGIIELGEDYEKVNQNIGRHLMGFKKIYVVSKEKKHPIYEGYLQQGGDKNCIEFVSCFKEGYKKCKDEKMDVLLIANDAFSTYLK